MQVSREYALKELRSAQEDIAGWIKELENPASLDASGEEKPLFPDGVPSGVAVVDLGLPVAQLRAELSGIAARIEALVMAG